MMANDGSWSMDGGAGFVFRCESVSGICLCTGGAGLREYRDLQMEHLSNILKRLSHLICFAFVIIVAFVLEFVFVTDNHDNDGVSTFGHSADSKNC